MKGKISKIFGKEIIDEKAVTQMENCLTEDGSIGVLSADAHAGYSLCVGGTVAYRDHISPSGVGYDIACGNKAVMTNIMYDDIKDDVSKIMDEIVSRVSFGVGRNNNNKMDHPVLQEIANSPFLPQRTLLNLATQQLGTVGSGNHFLDLFKDEKGFVWIGCHFGSRGFGHKTASGFLALDQTGDFFGRHAEAKDEPTLFHLQSEIGRDYFKAMSIAGNYAYAGRDWVVDEVRRILGADELFSVHNHHNFAWMEEHNGNSYCVVRKGATPAKPGQTGFIGANMLDNSVIIRGVDSQESRDGLYTTVHGAGRVMSRTQAAGKQKWIKGEDGKKRPQRVSKGLVDFDNTLRYMKENRVELRGAGADESPECYKKLTDVLEYHRGTIQIEHTLTPIGVAMAGADVEDPFRD